MFKILWTVVGFGLLSTAGFVNAMELSDAMQQAVKRDHRIKVIEAELQEADELISEANGAYYPVVRGEVGRTSNKDETVRDGSKRLVGLELSQNIWSSGRNEASVSYALAHANVSRAHLRRTINEVSVQVAEAWLEVVRVRHVQQLYRQYRKNIDNQLSGADEKSRMGVGRVTDVRLIRARLRQVEAEQRKVEAERLIALQELRRLVGRLPEPDLVQWPQQEVWPVPDDVAIHIDLYHLPGYQQQQFEVEKAGFDLDRQRAERRFSLDLEGSVVRGTFGAVKADNDSVMVVLNLPIYEGGVLRSRERSAQKRVERARQELREQEEQMLLAVKNSLATWQGSVEVVILMEEAVEAEQEAVAGVHQEVDAGIRSLMDALKADEELLQRKIGLIDARFEQWQSRFKLLGKIEAKELYLKLR